MADGVAVLQPDGSNVRGVVRFIDEMGGLRITYRVTGLTDGEHGFHIHEYGDLTDGCKSACAHFNPDGMTHGGLDTTVRHFGDLGNITSSDGVAEGKLFLDKGRLNTSNYGILGRMIIVHADRDDLGKGGDEESLKTGNAGKRLACGVIGLADPDTDTMTMDAEDILPRKCRECGTTENITTIQTGTFCFDCLPINLGAEDDLPDWVDHFTTGTNINPHDDPAYDEPYGQCESTFPDGSHCPDPARTGPFHYSQGYIGKVTACRECWDYILEDIEKRVQQGIDEFEDDSVGEITSTGDDTFDDDFQEEFAAEDNYDSTYGKEQAKIRRRLKNNLMNEATMGTKAGQWSARKSQELKRRYEAACERKGIKPYKGSKTTKQKDLSNWSKQGWRTASGRKSSVTGEPYFPAKAVKALKDKELYAKAKRQKAAATRAGKQRATYSKDIQAVVARYRAEDHTIDDLDDESLMIRMEDLAERMDAIVQRIGSYPDAERDPEYLRLVEQHTAYARVLARRHGFGAEDEDESDAIMAFRYMPESAYHRALEKGYMEPYGDHGATLATIDPTPTFYQTDGFYDGGHPLSDIYQIDLTGLQYRHHQVSAPQGQVILIEGDIPVDQIQPLSYSYANDGFSAESDPVSSVAAGTTDALNDFANSQDTDDKFYFIGGLIGGLAIAVLGNIISDRLQDVYFPHWWENRGGSKS